MNISRIRNVCRKEWWGDYSIILVLPLFWAIEQKAVENFATQIGIPYDVYSIIGLIVIALGFFVFVYAFYRDGKSVVQNPLDERDIQHELEVTKTSYHIVMFGIGTYLLLISFNWAIFSIFALALLARLWQRYQLEME
jgi:hypothetical protein